MRKIKLNWKIILIGPIMTVIVISLIKLNSIYPVKIVTQKIMLVCSFPLFLYNLLKLVEDRASQEYKNYRFHYIGCISCGIIFILSLLSHLN